MSINEEELEEVENEFPDLFDQAEEIVELEEKIVDLNIKWSKMILKLREDLSEEEFSSLEGARSMMNDFNERLQHKKEELDKLSAEIQAEYNAHQNRPEEQE